MVQFTLGLDRLPKKTRKEVFLDEMNQVVPWSALVALIAPFACGAHQDLGGRSPFLIETMLRIHCLQLCDPAPWRTNCTNGPCTGLDGAARMPDETAKRCALEAEQQQQQNRK